MTESVALIFAGLGALAALVFGPLLKKVAVARFTRTLGTMIASGVPILEALDIVERAGGKVARVLCLVERGEGAAEAFRDRGVTLEAGFTRADLPV